MELLRVMVSVDWVLMFTLAGANAALTVGGTGAETVTAAVAVAVLPPAGPVVSAFAGILLVYVPAVELDTGKVTVQLPLAGMIAPVSATLDPAACREAVVPPQVVEPVPVTLSEDGSVSMKSAWVSAKPFELLKVTVNTDVTVGPTVAGANASVMVGACGFTATAVKHA